MSRALVLDDDLNVLLGLSQLVEREGFEVVTAGDLATARGHLTPSPPDVVITDLMLPDGRGIDLIADLPPGSRTEFIVITGHATVESVIESLRAGVLDFLTKPVDAPRLKAVLANLVRTTELKAEIGTLRQQLRDLGRFGRLVGRSPAMQKVYDLMSKVAPTDASVLLVGESGTGKEIVAQTLHEISKRRRGPFLPLNCGAMPAGLIESELFGHEKGSFTGATQQRKGHFERASGGTLLLDEITEMPIELQVRLLRVLETGSALRIGGDAEVAVDARIIAATNRSPEQAVADGKLREDLLYRLNVFPIALPALRDRAGDVTLLAERFLEEINESEGAAKRFGPGVMARLKAYAWPGNVRELKNTIHRAFILAEEELDPEIPGEAPVAMRPPGDGVAPRPAHDGNAPRLATDGAGRPPGDGLAAPGTTLDEVERRMIYATLARHGGDKRRTAEELGIALKTLYNRLKRYQSEEAGPVSAPQVEPPSNGGADSAPL